MLEFDDDDLAKAIAEANQSGTKPENVAELIQGSRAWFEMRLGLFTGSKFPAIMTGGRAKGQEWGETAYGVIRQVYLERDLTEVGTQLYIEEMMTKEFRQTQWGKKYESFARSRYEELTGDVVLETGFMKHNIFGFVGGSFDGTIVNKNKIAEIKCPYDPLIHMANCEIEELDEKHKYYSQIQGNIEIAGVESCDFVSYDPRRSSNKIKIINVPRDEAHIIKLFERVAIGERAVHYMFLGLSCESSVILATDEIRNGEKSE